MPVWHSIPRLVACLWLKPVAICLFSCRSPGRCWAFTSLPLSLVSFEMPLHRHFIIRSLGFRGSEPKRSLYAYSWANCVYL